MKRFSAAALACLVMASISTALLPVTRAAAAPAATPAPVAPPANAPGQALEIAPPVINLTANPGETKKIQIDLRDIAPATVRVHAEVNDFEAAGEDGTPRIITDESTDNPYSIKKWLSPVPDMLLQPRQIKNLPVTITVPANAAPGGYYGVVRFTASAPELKSTGVSLSASLGSLILIRVNGTASEKLSVAEFSASKADKKAKLFDAAPIKFMERLKNSGNVFEQPTGHVNIKDMFGKTIARLNVNLPPRNILPGSIRKFEQPLDKTVIGDKRLFGKYTAELTVQYGANKQTVNDTMTFWVVPYKMIGIILLVLIIAIVVIRLMLKSYTNRILRGSRGRRRR